jgi:hypothetical protein
MGSAREKIKNRIDKLLFVTYFVLMLSVINCSFIKFKVHFKTTI